MKKTTKPQPYTKKLKQIRIGGGWRKQSFPGRSTRTGYLIPNGQLEDIYSDNILQTEQTILLDLGMDRQTDRWTDTYI